MTTPTVEQLQAIRAVCDAIIDTVKAAGPLGAPGGVLYAGLMTHGCSLAQFQSLMSALVRSGKLSRRGDCYLYNPPISDSIGR